MVRFFSAPKRRVTGAWLIHVVLVFTGKIIIDTIPGMTQQISWTLVNLIYLAVSVTSCCTANEMLSKVSYRISCSTT